MPMSMIMAMAIITTMVITITMIEGASRKPGALAPLLAGQSWGRGLLNRVQIRPACERSSGALR